MPNYQIKFTPLEYYFFGGEKHDSELKTNYFVESNDYPQQTTLLGLLRFFLLQKNNLISGKSLSSTNQVTATPLIGNESFDFSETKTFGKIKSLSPLYFNNGKKNFFFAPLDVKFAMDREFKITREGKMFNAKDYSKLVKQYLVSEDFEDIFELECIVRQVEQVGNEKGEKGKTKENAFYKQNMKRLEDKWSFVIDVEIDEKINETEDYFLPFGGEKCFFKLNFKEQSAFQPIYPKPKHERTVYTILCLSDCFVEGEKVKALEFAVNQYTSFRNLRSKISTQNFDTLKKGKDLTESQVRSNRYQLLQRGSVLYFSDIEKRNTFAKEIKQLNGFSIGFNHILTN